MSKLATTEPTPVTALTPLHDAVGDTMSLPNGDSIPQEYVPTAFSPEYEAILKARISSMVVARLTPTSILKELHKEGYKDVTSSHVTSLLASLTAEWEALAGENIKAAIGVELATLDAIQAELWPTVQEGNLKAISTLVTQIMAHRAKLLGLYAPTRQTVDVRKVVVKAYAGIDVDKV